MLESIPLKQSFLRFERIAIEDVIEMLTVIRIKLLCFLLAFTPHFDAGAVDLQMQTRRGRPAWNHHLQ